LRSGGVAEWRSGGVAEWRSGGVAEWRSGGVAGVTRYPKINNNRHPNEVIAFSPSIEKA
jgi:hypothetical protein